VTAASAAAGLAAGIQAVRETQIQAALDHKLFVSVFLRLPDARSAWRRARIAASDLRIFGSSARAVGACSETVNQGD